VLAALDGATLMVEYTLPFSSASDVPPLWVSVVGSDALWPVSIYPVQGNSIVFSRPPPPGKAAFLPRNFASSLYPQQINITFTLVILLCTLPHLYLMQRYRMKGVWMSRLYRGLGRITPRAPRWLERLLDDLPTVNRSNRRLSLLSFVLVLFTFFLVASAVWVLPLRAMSLWSLADSSSLSIRLLHAIRNNYQLLAWTILPTIVAGVLIFFGITGLTAKTVNQRELLEGDQASWTQWITFISSAFGVLLALWFVLSILCKKPLDALLYFVRAVHLWNGVSPLRPLLFVGVAALWLSVSELWRLSLSEEYVLTNDFLGFGDDGSFTGIGAHERATVDLLTCSTGRIPLLWLWLAMPFGVYLLLDFPGIKLIALDGRLFTWFFISIAFFVYTSLLSFFGRFIVVWFRLNELL